MSTMKFIPTLLVGIPYEVNKTLKNNNYKKKSSCSL